MDVCRVVVVSVTPMGESRSAKSMKPRIKPSSAIVKRERERTFITMISPLSIHASTNHDLPNKSSTHWDRISRNQSSRMRLSRLCDVWSPPMQSSSIPRFVSPRTSHKRSWQASVRPLSCLRQRTTRQTIVRPLLLVSTLGRWTHIHGNMVEWGTQAGPPARLPSPTGCFKSSLRL